MILTITIDGNEKDLYDIVKDVQVSTASKSEVCKGSVKLVEFNFKQ